MTEFPGVLESIGNTPLVQLRRVVPRDSAKVFAKLEFSNPTGSMKDRVAKAMIEAAEADGRLRPGGTVVEYTAGTTGISLALVCAAKGYRLKIVFSDAFSDEKRLTMQAFGAQVTEVKSEEKKITERLIKEIVETARRPSQLPDHWYCNDLATTTAPQATIRLVKRSGGRPGERSTRSSSRWEPRIRSTGVTLALQKHNPDLRVIAVEPAESAVLSGGPTGSHNIEGIGIGYVPPLWNPRLVNETIPVSTQEAQAMARRLAREEALFVGTSSGANVVAALRIAEHMGPEASVVTIMVDSGLRYLSTGLFGHVD